MNTTATLEAFSDALAAVGVDPHSVDVSLSVAEWKALDRQLSKENADALFERVGVGGEITLKGVRYLVGFG